MLNTPDDTHTRLLSRTPSRPTLRYHVKLNGLRANHSPSYRGQGIPSSDWLGHAAGRVRTR